MNLAKAALIAIGTEVTSGQIVNRNTSWMSQRLEALGIETLWHFAVPDDWDLMKKALKAAAQEADFIFTCGGLGPTTDDFTRKVISEFTQRELIFDAPSLKRIEEKLQQMGRQLLESQKQQCEFPNGAKILINPAGTASGFYMDLKDKHLWVLPGPPNEVATIWEDHIHEQLLQMVPQNQLPTLLTWNCLGRPEAELAELVEQAVQGSQLKTGYRLNAPFVEIKIWCTQDLLASQKPWINKIEKILDPWIVLKNKEDFLELLLEKRPENCLIQLYDGATDGLLSEKVAKYYREQKTQTDLQIEVHSFFKSEPPSLADKSHNLKALLLPMNQEGVAELHLFWNKEHHKHSLKSPFAHRLENERSRLAITEMTLMKVLELVQTT